MPVLLDPTIAGLNLKADGCFIDGTFGRGGHSSAILSHLGPDGRLIAIDRDPQAIAEADDSLIKDPRFELIHGEIAELENYAQQRQLLGKVDGLLLDLGVSSPQLDEAERGFSFQADGPLDMRMDPESGISAAEWLGKVSEQELRRVLLAFGEERSAGRIAKGIVAARSQQAITRTSQLADIVSAVVPRRGQKRHPATRTFQAIRMRINDEIGQLEAALNATIQLLSPGGRLCVISFHSLEDRPVKRFMRSASQVPAAYRGLPNIPAKYQPSFLPPQKAIKATDAEIATNPRSRSARLRVAERT